MAISPGPVWPDAAGTPTDPTNTVFTVSSRVLAPTSLDRELHCVISVGGTVPKAIQFIMSGSYWGQTNYVPIESRTVLCSTGVGSYYTTFRGLPADCEAVLSCMRWGGDATTTVVVNGYARENVGLHLANGQPEELAMAQPLGIECWGDGAGGHAHPAAGPGAHVPEPQAAANQQWIPTGESDTLVIDYLVAALAATTIEFEIRESFDFLISTSEQVAVNSVTAGVISCSVAQEQCPGTLGRHQTREIPVKPNTAILVLAQRTGGGANTEMIALARLFKMGR